MKYLLRFVFVLFTIFLSTLFLSAQQILKLKPGAEGKDATLQSNFRSTNFGDSEVFSGEYVMEDSTGYLVRSIIYFDLDTLPEEAEIKNATLVLYRDTTNEIREDWRSSFFINRIQSPWEEDQVTWNNQPGINIGNQVYIDQRNLSRADFKLEINVRNIIRFQRIVPDMGHGMMLRAQGESFENGVVFASGDSQDSTLHPELIIEYRLPSNTTEVEKLANILPNPVLDELSIQAPNIIWGIAIFDEVGRPVYTEDHIGSDKKQIQVGHLPKGMYVVKLLMTNGQTQSQKFIKL